MELIDIVRKLAGPIEPIGETNTDEVRFENLKKLTQLVGALLGDIDTVAHNRTRYEFSMKRAGRHAFNFLCECEQWIPEKASDALMKRGGPIDSDTYKR